MKLNRIKLRRCKLHFWRRLSICSIFVIICASKHALNIESLSNLSLQSHDYPVHNKQNSQRSQFLVCEYVCWRAVGAITVSAFRFPCNASLPRFHRNWKRKEIMFAWNCYFSLRLLSFFLLFISFHCFTAILRLLFDFVVWRNFVVYVKRVLNVLQINNLYSNVILKEKETFVPHKIHIRFFCVWFHSYTHTYHRYTPSTLDCDK